MRPFTFAAAHTQHTFSVYIMRRPLSSPPPPEVAFAGVVCVLRLPSVRIAVAQRVVAVMTTHALTHTYSLPAGAGASRARNKAHTHTRTQTGFAGVRLFIFGVVKRRHICH